MHCCTRAASPSAGTAVGSSGSRSFRIPTRWSSAGCCRHSVRRLKPRALPPVATHSAACSHARHTGEHPDLPACARVLKAEHRGMLKAPRRTQSIAAHTKHRATHTKHRATHNAPVHTHRAARSKSSAHIWQCAHKAVRRSNTTEGSDGTACSDSIVGVVAQLACLQPVSLHACAPAQGGVVVCGWRGRRVWL
jgi:hypothetical protein